MSVKSKEPASANPSKEFFIGMLTRDIPLDRAILDLVDNCIDGARRIRPDAAKRFDGLYIKISTRDGVFRVEDNCGGISYELAKNYAFCFGRPDNAPASPSSIGRFGVGMKRAIFKLGKHAEISTCDGKTDILVVIDVQNFLDDTSREWTFPMDVDRNPGTKPPGTVLEVKTLNDEARAMFDATGELNNLAIDIESAHYPALSQGLAIFVNDVPMRIIHQSLFSSDVFSPICNIWDDGQVKIKMLVGIGESDPSQAGWYVYCNGRLILEADQGAASGWGERAKGGVPFFHNEYSRFRGFLYLDSENPDVLPWNTTKTGINTGALLYRRILANHMRPAHRLVIDWMNMIKRQKAVPLDMGMDEVMEKEVTETLHARLLTVDNFSAKSEFKAPDYREATAEETARRKRIVFFTAQEYVERATLAFSDEKVSDVAQRAFERYVDKNA